MMRESIVVYYAPFTSLERQPMGHMMFPSPKPVHKEMRLNKVNGKSSYMICNAYKETFANTFVLEHPVDLDLDFDNNRARGKNSDWTRPRESSFQNSISFDLSCGIILFCEEDLEVMILPPIFQKTQLPNYGFLASGGFNIGRWFRPIHPSYFLWEGVSKFKCEAGEPWGYLKFLTKTEIIFKPFYMTQTLEDISTSCSHHPQWYPFQNLEQRYKSLKASHLKGKIIKEIKQNLLDEEPVV